MALTPVELETSRNFEFAGITLSIETSGSASFEGEQYVVTAYSGEERPGDYNDDVGFTHLHGFFSTHQWTLSRPDATLVFTVKG